MSIPISADGARDAQSLSASIAAGNFLALQSNDAGGPRRPHRVRLQPAQLVERGKRFDLAP